MTAGEKHSYIAAEKCLMSLPAKLGLPAARTRFDELQMIHVKQTTEGPIHGVGAFLPFHRYFVHLHETLLRSECNFTGGHPYWDEPLDAGNFAHSIVLDPDHGFGGNGSGKENCITDGPFKDYVNAIGPGENITDHCINRIVDDCMSQQARKSIIDDCLKKKSFVDMWNCLEVSPHSAGHAGIGGQMFDVFSSPGDPLFYLHHGWLDKLWADWQSQNTTIRLSEIGGTNQGINFIFPAPGNGTNFPFPFPPPGNGTNGTFPFPTLPPVNVFPNCPNFPFPPGFGTMPPSPHFPDEFIPKMGDPQNVTTLGHVLTTYGALPDVTVADVMDVQGGYLCYEYV